MRDAALICSGLRHRAAPTARAAQAVQTAPAEQAAPGDAESTELHRSCARILISKQKSY